MGTAHKYTIHSPNLNHKSEMGSPDWNMSMVNIHLQRFLWMYCPGHAELKGNDQAKTGGKSNHHKWLVLQKTLSAEELK